MQDLDKIDSKLELCMRIIRGMLDCPSCREKAKLEIENYTSNTPKEGGSSVPDNLQMSLSWRETGHLVDDTSDDSDTHLWLQ